MKRRNMLKNLVAASAAVTLPLHQALAQSSVPKTVGLGTVKITDVKTILTARRW